MKNNFKRRHLCIFLCLLACGRVTAQTPSAFDDMFKDFDFDKFLGEMEKEFDKQGENKEFGPASTPKKAGAPVGVPAGTQTQITITKTDLAEKTKSKEELFLHPNTQTVQEKGKAAKVSLTPASRNAFREVMKEFITLLHALEVKVTGMRQFSLPFKEEFMQYLEAFDRINIAYGTIISKKLYSTVMPYQALALDAKTAKDAQAKQPPPPTVKQPQGGAELMSLRQDILNAIKELKTLTASIKYDPKKEEKEGADEARLRSLSKRHPKVIEFTDKPIVSKKRKARHGSKKSVVESEEKKTAITPKHRPVKKITPLFQARPTATPQAQEVQE